MRKEQTYRSGFLKAEALRQSGGGFSTLTLTIDGIRTHEFDNGDVQRVISFAEDDREFGLNPTNWDNVAEVTGQPDDEHWAGHRVELYVDPQVRFKGKVTPAIRIRRPQGGPANAPAQPAPPTAAPPPQAAPPPAPAGPPPQGLPYAPTGTGTKDAAWAFWCAKHGGNPSVDLWRKAIAAINKPEPQFTAADWQAVANAADIPF